jgi:hypothetical protein
MSLSFPSGGDSQGLPGEPVFVVGAERSGSTLLRLMLDHHPDISVPHEYDFLVRLIGDDGRFPELSAYHAFLGQNAVFLRSGFRIDPSLDFLRLQESFLEQRRRGRAVVGGVVHLDFSRLLFVWPHARFVHLVRDPRAVARSVVEMGWAGNVWAAARRWVDAEREWARVEERVPATRRFTVRYEDLVRDPARVLGSICAFIGVPFSPRMLEYASDSTYDPPDPNRLGVWQTRLSARDQRLVDARVGEWLERAGYPRCPHPPLHPSAPGRAWLHLDHRIRRALFGLRRYGPRLFVEYAIARRWGSEVTRRRVRERVRAVDQEHVL